MKTTTNTLQLTNEGYTGLQGAVSKVHQILRNLADRSPVRYEVSNSESEKVIIFTGNGTRVTLHVESLSTKGGEK